MATTTTNFGWTVPSDTDLVKDGAAAIRTALGGVDTSMVDLKGGTTGQVLSKASNTDMDFTWVAQDDSNAIQNAIVDAKGDLIAATAADTPARLAVGTNGQVLTADSTAATGLAWANQSSGALVLLATANPSAAASTAINSCFSSTYDDYVMTFDFSTISSDTHYGIRLRSGSTDATTGYSWSGSGIASNGTIDDFGYESQNYLGLGYVTATYASGGFVTLHNPFLTRNTLAIGTAVRASSASRSYNNVYAGALHNSTSYDGVTIFSPANLTGTVRVYGVAK
jgi:hypothetical protein